MVSSMKAKKIKASMAIVWREHTLADRRHDNLPANAAPATRDGGGLPVEWFQKGR